MNSEKDDTLHADYRLVVVAWCGAVSMLLGLCIGIAWSVAAAGQRSEMSQFLPIVVGMADMPVARAMLVVLERLPLGLAVLLVVGGGGCLCHYGWARVVLVVGATATLGYVVLMTGHELYWMRIHFESSGTDRAGSWHGYLSKLEVSLYASIIYSMIAVALTRRPVKQVFSRAGHGSSRTPGEQVS